MQVTEIHPRRIHGREDRSSPETRSQEDGLLVQEFKRVARDSGPLLLWLLHLGVSASPGTDCPRVLEGWLQQFQVRCPDTTISREQEGGRLFPVSLVKSEEILEARLSLASHIEQNYIPC